MPRLKYKNFRTKANIWLILTRRKLLRLVQFCILLKEQHNDEKNCKK